MASRSFSPKASPIRAGVPFRWRMRIPSFSFASPSAARPSSLAARRARAMVAAMPGPGRALRRSLAGLAVAWAAAAHGQAFELRGAAGALRAGGVPLALTLVDAAGAERARFL